MRPAQVSPQRATPHSQRACLAGTMPPMPTPPAVDHYENFPVASWLCPPHLRPAVAALYHFARTADDLADEGDAPADLRLQHLSAYRADLEALREGRMLLSPWADTIGRLAPHIAAHQLAWSDLSALLDAFTQDVRFTALGRRYTDMAELLDYCDRSANPVGRLMLRIMLPAQHITADHIACSDQICSALQLINFWQDLSVDTPRQRHYIPQSVWLAYKLDPFSRPDQAPEHVMRLIVQELVDDARRRMLAGAPLALQVPGRLGWELRAVVQGGLRITEHIARSGYRSWLHRPQLGRSDALRIAWRCWRMGSDRPHL